MARDFKTDLRFQSSATLALKRRPRRTSSALRGRQPVRDPRQARHDHAEGHPARPPHPGRARLNASARQAWCTRPGDLSRAPLARSGPDVYLDSVLRVFEARMTFSRGYINCHQSPARPLHPLPSVPPSLHILRSTSVESILEHLLRPPRALVDRRHLAARELVDHPLQPPFSESAASSTPRSSYLACGPCSSCTSAMSPPPPPPPPPPPGARASSSACSAAAWASRIAVSLRPPPPPPPPPARSAPAAARWRRGQRSRQLGQGVAAGERRLGRRAGAARRARPRRRRELAELRRELLGRRLGVGLRLRRLVVLLLQPDHRGAPALFGEPGARRPGWRGWPRRSRAAPTLRRRRPLHRERRFERCSLLLERLEVRAVAAAVGVAVGVAVAALDVAGDERRAHRRRRPLILCGRRRPPCRRRAAEALPPRLSLDRLQPSAEGIAPRRRAWACSARRSRSFVAAGSRRCTATAAASPAAARRPTP